VFENIADLTIWPGAFNSLASRGRLVNWSWSGRLSV
jgi:hypothetical protein